MFCDVSKSTAQEGGTAGQEGGDQEGRPEEEGSLIRTARSATAAAQPGFLIRGQFWLGNDADGTKRRQHGAAAQAPDECRSVVYEFLAALDALIAARPVHHASVSRRLGSGQSAPHLRLAEPGNRRPLRTGFAHCDLERPRWRRRPPRCRSWPRRRRSRGSRMLCADGGRRHRSLRGRFLQPAPRLGYDAPARQAACTGYCNLGRRWH
jgi:hypothetical protein